MKRNRNENLDNHWQISILRTEFEQASIQQLSDRILALYRGGLTQKEIANELRIGSTSVYRAIRAAGASGAHRERAQLRSAEIVARYNEGLGPTAIAQSLGVARSSVNKILKDLRVPRSRVRRQSE